MVPEIGNIALTLALVLSILLAVYPPWGLTVSTKR